MPSSPKRFGTKYLVYPDGRVWKEEHTTTRADGVSRTWCAKWQPTRIRRSGIGSGGGYVYIDLDGKTYLLHRIVASLFLENPENLTDVNHKDGDRSNNNVNNLEWISKSDNQKHAYSVLKRKRTSKLNDEQIVEVFNLRNNDNLPLKEIAARFGINFRTVSEISKGKRFCLHKEDNTCA